MSGNVQRSALCYIGRNAKQGGATVQENNLELLISEQRSTYNLKELEAHEEFHVPELKPLVVEERYGADTRPQFHHRKRGLPAEVVLAHVLLVHLHAEHRDLGDGQREDELILPHGHPAVLHGLRLHHYRV
jgi:hypothetical protein